MRSRRVPAMVLVEWTKIDKKILRGLVQGKTVIKKMSLPFIEDEAAWDAMMVRGCRSVLQPKPSGYSTNHIYGRSHTLRDRYMWGCEKWCYCVWVGLSGACSQHISHGHKHAPFPWHFYCEPSSKQRTSTRDKVLSVTPATFYNI